MYTYDRLFLQYNHTVAQILLTGEDVDHAERRQNFENTLERLLELGALPIINENDTIATAEIKVGDNDTLGAIVACSVHADLLVLLSDIEGLYTACLLYTSQGPEAVKALDHVVYLDHCESPPSIARTRAVSCSPVTPR